MRVLFLEPFCGGSHRLFAERFAALSAHDVRLLSLPASFWKWRMRGGHLVLAEKARGLRENFDCLLTTDMLSLAELLGIAPELAALVRVVYFHENQLSYPVPKGESPDVHFGFTNLSTALAADRLVFNSRFHLQEFLGGIGPFLRAMPDHRPRRVAERLEPRAAVVYPGIDCRELDAVAAAGPAGGPPTILWNHRWEFDKRPETFFGVLRRLAGEGLGFRVRVVGENFQAKPRAFLEAREFLGEKLVSFGFAEDRRDYVRELRMSDVVVSTAIQEFYGMAVLEAAYCGCLPLVPDRLVYPELYPPEALYRSEEELQGRLADLLRLGLPGGPWRERQRAAIGALHDARRAADLLDRIIEETVDRKREGKSFP